MVITTGVGGDPEERRIYNLYHLGFTTGINGLPYGHRQPEATSATTHYQAGYRQGINQHQWREDNIHSWKVMARSMTECLLRDYPGGFYRLRQELAEWARGDAWRPPSRGKGGRR